MSKSRQSVKWNVKKRRRSADRNLRLSTDVLPLVIQEVNSWPDSPKVAYLRKHYLSKFVSKESPVTSEERRARAIAKWQATEARNSETNERLFSQDPGTLILPGVTYGRFVEWVRAFIARVIGDTPPGGRIPTRLPLLPLIVSEDAGGHHHECVLIGAFSGGATTSRKRTQGHPARKYVGTADITQSAMDWFELVVDECPLWSNTTKSALGVHEINVVPGSVLFTVPKNAEIDRVACKEPDINMYLQKGCGDFIRRRLMREGINLNDQSRNRQLAMLGSREGSYATLDLSSASDSVSCAVVETFLPLCWYSLLDDIRSKSICVDGTWQTCEMFSSMGNGFTFELESLLFYAFARATTYFLGIKGIVSVYGDDIIVPTGAAEALKTVLTHLGFIVNDEKSFVDGPVRESCGGHYHYGMDVTPFYIRGPITTLVDLIHLLNEIRRWAARSESEFLDELAWPLWDLLSEQVPRCFWGGDLTSAGNTQLISPHEPVSRLVQRKEKRELPAVGQYLAAMNKIMNRRGPPNQPATQDDGSVVLAHYGIAPAVRYGWHDPGMWFLAELIPDLPLG